MQIYDILKQEHEDMKGLLNDLIDLKEDDEYRFILVEEIKTVLIPHTRAEEATFYNTLRAVDADKSIVASGFVEHMEAESLLRLLSAREKIHLDWKPTALKLREALSNHIAKEESEIFTEARKMFSTEEAESIGDAYLRLKPSFVGDGVVKSVMDMVINMLPPRLADGIRGVDNTKH